MSTEGIIGPVTVQAGEALAQYRRVKIESGTTEDPPEVVYADAGEAAIGVTVDAAANGDLVAIVPVNMTGLQYVTAAGAFARGAALYADADGKVSTTVVGSSVGTAFEAAGADGDVVLAMINS
jgi:hypothetical protein